MTTRSVDGVAATTELPYLQTARVFSDQPFHQLITSEASSLLPDDNVRLGTPLQDLVTGAHAAVADKTIGYTRSDWTGWLQPRYADFALVAYSLEAGTLPRTSTNTQSNAFDYLSATYWLKMPESSEPCFVNIYALNILVGENDTTAHGTKSPGYAYKGASTSCTTGNTWQFLNELRQFQYQVLDQHQGLDNSPAVADALD